VDVLGLNPGCAFSEEAFRLAGILDEEHPVHHEPTVKKKEGATLDKAEVRRVPIGEHFYLFTTGKSSHDHPPRLVITSHGGFWEKAVAKDKPGSHFDVPANTDVHFYVEHGKSLIDPGFEEVLGMKPHESFGPGDKAVNYQLSKFQGKKTGETYEGISNKLSESQGKIGRQKVLLGEQGIHLDDPGDAKDRIDKRTAVVDAQYKQKMDQLTELAKNGQGQSDEANQLRKDLGTLEADRTALRDGTGTRQYEGYDVLTVRNRPGKGGTSVADAISDLGKNGYQYQEIHGNFCRSPIRYPWQSDPPSAEATPDPRWGRPPGFVRNPPSSSGSGGSG
jgi:hypothetical protein